MANDSTFEQRLKTFALLLKFNHDLFGGESFENAASMAVNETCQLLNFVSASLWELKNKQAVLRGQFAQPSVNIHAARAVAQKKMIESLQIGSDPLYLDSDNGLPKELASADTVYFCLKLPIPPAIKNPNSIFIWVLEYSETVPSYVRNTAQILGNSIANALYFYKNTENKIWKVRKRLPRLLWGSLIILSLVGIMFLQIRENVSAEFMLKPTNIAAAYAWFDGPVAKCFKQDGVYVKQGEPIIQYDTRQIQYRVSMAQMSLREIEAELALEQQNSFTDSEKLGKVKLLEAKRDTLQISVRESEWYLEHSLINAPADGILSLPDGRSDLLEGKAVKTGDKLFEIYGGNGMLAEISVSEENSSILQKQFHVDLFLHTAPEKSIPAVVTEISHYPELSPERTYCYTVRAELPCDQSDLRYGMRGVAKLSGRRVALGYYLFKNIILYFRSI